MSAFALFVSLGGVVGGCQDKARPWEQAGGASDAPSASFTPPLPPLPSSFLVDTPDAAKAEPDAVAPDTPPPVSPDDPLPRPVRIGGPWVRCYGSFHPSGEPLKDVTRLGLLCGPETGMRRVSKQAVEGSVAEGQAPLVERFAAHKGACYRIFAVAEPAVLDLDVVVRSSRGSAIAADHSEDVWPIVQPDRPFCPLEDDTLAVEVSARRGRGRAAAEIWALRVMSD